jgi:membrane-associated phospholipid phosphatase
MRPPADNPVPGPIARTLHELATMDCLIVGYLAALFLLALLRPVPNRAANVACTAVLLLAMLATLVLVRGRVSRHPFGVPLVHRSVAFGTVQASYFLLYDLLPKHLVDERLLRLDVRLFGVEPTLWADQFVTPHRTEWFAFFYYSYFFLLAVHVGAIWLFSRTSRHLDEFALALFSVVIATHLLYFVVPALGPVHYLAGQFGHAFPHGTWYDLVMKTVAAGGAERDVFPSLHTGAPTVLALFSFRHRREWPFKYTWPIITFFTVNIVGATIYLRWHYLVDVVAGLLLAAICVATAGWVTAWETRRRERLGLMPVCPPWPPTHSPEPSGATRPMA